MTFDAALYPPSGCLTPIVTRPEISPVLQGTPLGIETQYLLARYRSGTLGSGFVDEGTFRRPLTATGRNRDNARFAMLDSERPAH